MFLRSYITRLKERPLVRPWGLAAPILVLLIALPLLRPLRHPMAWEMSSGEQSRLATIQAVVEHHTLAIDDTNYANTPDSIQVGQRTYSDQPPIMAVLLAGPYWAMHWMGWTLAGNPTLVIYLLTLLGVTIPVALSAGLIYRMGRRFELRRPWRTFLAAAVVLGSGLISYAVVLNAHAPAAFLVLCAAACLTYVSMSHRPRRSCGWLAVAGFCAALAASMDLPAAAFLFLFVPVILTLRWRLWGRLGGVGLYALGVLPVLALHAALIVPITGDILPPTLHPELAAAVAVPPAKPAATNAPADLTDALLYPDDEDLALQHSSWRLAAARNIGHLGAALFGDHGAVSHFPVLLVALLGMAAVMHRHWPLSTKALAVATLIGSCIIIAGCALWRSDWTHAMFGARWFIVFLPLLIFWCGAWLRRSHRPLAWTLAGVLLAFSVIVSLIGATDPCPRNGFQTYTAVGALDNIVHPEPAPLPNTALAGG
jgi:hypothetical protein